MPNDSNQDDTGSGPLTAPLLEQIVATIRDIRYGAVEIVIHDGRIVQIERKEKVRFEPVRKRPN